MVTLDVQPTWPPQLERFRGTGILPDDVDAGENIATKPFENDEAYLKHVHVCLAAWSLAGTSLDKEGKPTKLAERASHVLASRVRASAENGSLPRLERVAAKLELSAAEIRALQFITLHNLGAEFDKRAVEYSTRSACTNLQRCACMTPKELLDFLEPSRVHMEQGIFEVDEGFEGTFRGQNYKMQREVLAALVGGRLGAEEFLKIDGTVIAEVLSEDGVDPIERATLNFDSKADVSTDSAQPDADTLLSRLKSWVSPQGQADNSEQEGKEQIIQESCSDGAIEEIPKELTGASSQPFLPEEGGLCAYKDDLEYLADRFEVVAARLKIYMLSTREDNDTRDPLDQKQRPEIKEREFAAQERSALRKFNARLSLTPQPELMLRIERLRYLAKLSDFEVWVVVTLIGGIISQDVRKIGSSTRFGGGTVSFDVGTLLGTHCRNLRDQMSHRRAFYRGAPLLHSGIVRIADSRRLGAGDLMDSSLEMDRRMLDYCVGLETEFGELVHAAHLYAPDIDIQRVILPADVKSLILGTVDNYTKFRKHCKQIGLSDMIEYGLGIVLLFHGPPGTGKTMLANALANHLNKKLLLVTMPMFSENPPDAVKQVLREATIENALVFFDECDALFESRERSKIVMFLLTEIERFDGLIILATNRVSELDEAMHRRITLSIEFPAPDPFLRQQIWKAHVPESLRVSGDVDWGQLSMDYELSGGFIKNALVTALSFAVARAPAEQEDVDVEISTEDLHKACKLQVRSQLVGLSAERRIIPKRGLTDLVLPKSSLLAVRRIIDYERARKVLQSQWGFDDASQLAGGTTCVFAGPRGTGKTLAAEAIAYELARPLRVMSCLEVLTTYRTSRDNAATLLDNARQGQAVLALEGAEILLGDSQYGVRERRDGADFLLFHVERAGGVVILCCTTSSESREVQVPSHRLKFQVSFPRPDAEARAALWQKMLPERAPRSADVNFTQLAAEFDLDGAAIKTAVLRAAALAALRPLAEGEAPEIKMQDFKRAGQEELDHFSHRKIPQGMYG